MYPLGTLFVLLASRCFFCTFAPTPLTRNAATVLPLTARKTLPHCSYAKQAGEGGAGAAEAAERGTHAWSLLTSSFTQEGVKHSMLCFTMLGGILSAVRPSLHPRPPPLPALCHTFPLSNWPW
jgi:hypothetical protein